MEVKAWTKTVILIWISIIVIMGVIVIVIDPYHHYHEPLMCFDYAVGDAVYTNDGKCKNFEYEALITGTSMTTGFDEVEAGNLFGKSFLRATFLGEGYKRINDNLKTAIQYNDKLKVVIRSVDTLWFVTGVDWLAYEDYPIYLYNDKLLDDAQYLYNFDIWMDAVIPTMRTLHPKQRIEKENQTTTEERQKEYLEKEKAIDNYIRPERSDTPINEDETAEFYDLMDDNLYYNLLQTVEENPEIEFYFYFPPYSILWWDSINQAGAGRVERRIEMENYAIEKILAYENVRLFSFSDNFELVCNLDNYSDDIHYRPNVNSQILNWMKEEEYLITKENYLEYIERIRDFYVNYDYDAIFENSK